LLVLEGAGHHFCAGFDFTDLEDCSDGDLAIRFIRIEILLQLICHAPFATLALVQGKALGAGADLVAACDGRIGAPDSAFRFPGLAFGVVLGVRRLADRIGEDQARRILSAGETLDARAAMDAGLLTAIVAHSEWEALVTQELARNSRLTPLATAALHRRTRRDTRCEDMAELAHAVAAPGLQARIRGFRSEVARKA